MSIGSGGALRPRALGDGRPEETLLPARGFHTDFIFSHHRRGARVVRQRARHQHSIAVVLWRGFSAPPSTRPKPLAPTWPWASTALIGFGALVNLGRGAMGAASDQGTDPCRSSPTEGPRVDRFASSPPASCSPSPSLAEASCARPCAPGRPTPVFADRFQEAPRGKLLIAGGGTGGHLFPGIAHRPRRRFSPPAAQRRGLRGHRPRRHRGAGPSPGGFSPRADRCDRSQGQGSLLGLLPRHAAAFLARRVRCCSPCSLLRSASGRRGLGVGGYASSGPVLLAAWLLGLPTAIQEQERRCRASPTACSGRFVRVVFTAFREASQPLPAFQGPRPGETPSRRALLEKLPSQAAGSGASPCLMTPPRSSCLVLGGSLGARRDQRGLSASSAPRSRVASPRTLRARLCRRASDRRVRRPHRARPIARRVCAPTLVGFIDDMSRAYQEARPAHLSRGGQHPRRVSPFATARPSSSRSRSPRTTTRPVNALGAREFRRCRRGDSHRGERGLTRGASLRGDRRIARGESPSSCTRWSSAAATLGRPEAAPQEIVEVLRPAGPPSTAVYVRDV